MREERATSGTDRLIANLAARQHGVVPGEQLLAAGLSTSGLSRRVRAGRLHRLHRGVYAVGHPRVSREGRWLAAVMTCGAGAVLSHRAAAALWGMRAWNGYPEVTVPGRGGRRRRHGLILHRSSTLRPEATTSKEGIPVTTPSRTLADLRRLIPADQVRTAVRQAEILRLDTGPQPEYESDRSRTELEHLFLRLCRRHRLPEPEVNVPIGPFTADFLWRDQRLIVETDGYETHGTRSSFESDRAKDASLRRRGFDVQRFTYRQVTNKERMVAATVRAMLVRAARPAGPAHSISGAIHQSEL